MKVEGGYLYNVIVMDVGRVGPCEVLKLRNVRPRSEMKRPSDEAARRSAVIDKVKSLIDGLKPAKNYIANTVQASHGHFHAIWASPGLKPDFVYDGCGSALFDDVKSAEAKAGEVLFDALNNDLRLKKQSKRRRLPTPKQHATP
jgi:hypothetical protein